MKEIQGYSFINNPYGRKLTEEETIELGSECLGIIAGVELYNKKIIDNLPSLRCISRVGVGMDSIDLSYAKEKGISILNTPNGPTQAVAELALGLTMSCLRYICQAHYNMKNQIWKHIWSIILKSYSKMECEKPLHHHPEKPFEKKQLRKTSEEAVSTKLWALW